MVKADKLEFSIFYYILKPFKFLLLSLVALSFPAFAMPECLEKDDPPPYTGQLFDAMAQTSANSVILERMDEAGVQRMALFPRINKHENGTGTVTALKSKYPERFVIGTAKFFNLREDLPGSYISQTISNLREGPYKFVGEILFVHADKSIGETTVGGERYISADAPNVFRFMQELQTLNLPVMTHWEVYNWQRDWPKFHQLYEKFPEITFIWPHAGFGSAEQAESVLSQHKNVMITLSKLETDQSNFSSELKEEQLGGAIVDECGLILPEWRALIARYPTRFMFATDVHRAERWEKYTKVVRKWRKILGQLPDSQAKLVAWENAEMVYGKPR